MKNKNIYFFLAATFFLAAGQLSAQSEYGVIVENPDFGNPINLNDLGITKVTAPSFDCNSGCPLSFPPSYSFLNQPGVSPPPNASDIVKYHAYISTQIAVQTSAFGKTENKNFPNVNTIHNAQGDPIDTFSGKPRFNTADFSYSRTGFPIRFERFYNEDFFPADAGLGTNWATNYDWCLVVPDSSPAFQPTVPVTLFTPTNVYSFSPKPDTLNYDPEPGCFFNLLRIGTEIPGSQTVKFGTVTNASFSPVSEGNGFVDSIMNSRPDKLSYRYRLTDKNGTKYYFGHLPYDFPNCLRLVAIQDKNGNAIQLVYEKFLKGVQITWLKVDECSFLCTGWNFCCFGSGQVQVGGSGTGASFDCHGGRTFADQQESDLYALRLFRVENDLASWRMEFKYNDDPPPVLPHVDTNNLPQSFSYRNKNGHRIKTVSAIDHFATSPVVLASLEFKYDNTVADYAPVTQVLRTPSGLNSNYAYLAESNLFYLNKIDDVLGPAGNRHASFVRGGVSPLVNYINSRHPVTKALNGRGQTVFSYQYSVNATQPSLDTATLITGSNGFYQRDVYRDGIWAEKEFKIDGATYREKYEYNSNRLVTKFTDGNTHATLFDYDDLGNATFIQDAKGNKEYFEYDNSNHLSKLIKVTDARTKITDILYDANGNPTDINEPLGKTTKLTYFTTGAKRGLVNTITTKISASQSHTTVMDYDPNGNLDTLGEPAPSGSTNFDFDAKGRLVQKTDALLKTTVFAWNNQDRLDHINFPDTTSQSYGYDANGNVNSMTGPKNTVIYQYDIDDNLTDSTEAGTAHTQYSYDEFGNRKSLSDPNTKKTLFSYNEQNRLKRVQDPVGKAVDYTYDGAFNIKTQRDSRGIIVVYDYYENNRLKKLGFSDSTPPISFVYDENGNRTDMQDGESHKTYVYDDLNRLTDVHNPAAANFDQHYTYYLDESRQTMQNFFTGTTTYNYYDNNLLKSVVDKDGLATTYAYTGLNQVDSISYANGVRTTYGYQPMSRNLEHLSHLNSKSEYISKHDIDFDSAGNATMITGLEGQTKFKYDNLDRLTDVTYPGSKGHVNYGYDDAGNRAYVADDSGTATYNHNDANEIQSAGGETFTFDQAGNMKTRTKSGQTITYVWDALNRLVEVRKPAEGKTVRYTYNGDNVRVKKELVTSSGTVTTRYLLDNLSVVAEVDGSGSLVRGYNPGIGTFDSQNTKLFYLHDGQGNVIKLVDEKGNVVSQYIYDAYGELIGADGDEKGYRFLGRMDVFSDSDVDIQYMLNRWYDPRLGRFLSRDPVGFIDGPNLYAYVQNNPLNLIDPFGLHSDKPWWMKLGEGYYYGTSAAQSSAQWYADRFVATQNPAAKIAYFSGGVVATTWTPEMFKTTGLMLGTGGLAQIAGLSKLQFFWKLGPSWHFGIELPGQLNIIHLGNHIKYGIHVALGYLGPRCAYYHIYFQRAFPFFRLWWP